MYQYLTPKTTARMRAAVAEMTGMIAVAMGIADKSVSESVVAKIEAAIGALKARYAEINKEDGTVLVKHPAIGFVTVKEALREEPIRLFASKVKALSSVTVTLYGADALVATNGNVSYINRKKIIEVEMTQMAFAALLANPGRGEYPATIRELDGTPISYDGDLNHIRGKLMFNETQESTEGIAQWATKLVEAARASTEKGGVMSKTARQEMAHHALILTQWGQENPGYYAEMLADYTAATTTDMKMEVMSANKIMGKN